MGNGKRLQLPRQPVVLQTESGVEWELAGLEAGQAQCGVGQQAGQLGTCSTSIAYSSLIADTGGRDLWVDHRSHWTSDCSFLQN